MQTPAGVSVCIVAGSAARMMSLATGHLARRTESSCTQATIDLDVSIFSILVIACITIFIHVTHACRPLGFAQMSKDSVLGLNAP